MSKLSAEERHKKQLEKLKEKQNISEEIYQKKQSEKELAVEQLINNGYKVDDTSGIPMFKVNNQKDVDTIILKLKGKGSYGFVYAKESNLKFNIS